MAKTTLTIQDYKNLLVKKKIKRFDINCSIDCWGKRQEYIRYGLNLDNWQKNFEMLTKNGLDKFAQTISRNYFTWVDFTDAQISNLVNDRLLETKNFPFAKIHPGFTPAESFKHNILIYLNYVNIINDSNNKSDIIFLHNIITMFKKDFNDLMIFNINKKFQ